MYKKAGRPDKMGKPKFKGSIADQVKRLAKKKYKKVNVKAVAEKVAVSVNNGII